MGGDAPPVDLLSSPIDFLLCATLCLRGARIGRHSSGLAVKTMHISIARGRRVDGKRAPSTPSRMLGVCAVDSGHAGHGRLRLVWLEATSHPSEELTRDLRRPGREFS